MEELIKTAAQYGVAGVALVALGWLCLKIGQSIVLAIRELKTASDANAAKISEDFIELSKGLTAAVTQLSKELGLVIAQSHVETLGRLSSLSERITRIEARIDLDDDTATNRRRQG